MTRVWTTLRKCVKPIFLAGAKSPLGNLLMYQEVNVCDYLRSGWKQIVSAMLYATGTVSCTRAHARFLKNVNEFSTATNRSKSRVRRPSLPIHRQPIQLLHLGPLLHHRRSHFPPRRMVPRNRLQSIVGRLKNHSRLNRHPLHGIEPDRNLAAGIDPMAKQRARAIPRIFCNRRAAIRPQAYVHEWTRRMGKVNPGKS